MKPEIIICICAYKIPLSFIFNSGFIYEATKLGTQGMPVHRVFTSEELKNATGNFNVSALIGEGCNGKVLCHSRFTDKM